MKVGMGCLNTLITSFILLAFTAEASAQQDGACLAGVWGAVDRASPASSLELFFDGKGRVLVSFAPEVKYIPAGVVLPEWIRIEQDAASQRASFAVNNLGRYVLDRFDPGETLVLRTEGQSARPGDTRETKFRRRSGDATCEPADLPGVAVRDPGEPSARVAVEDEYSALQAFDGFGAIFIGVGEPVLFPIHRAKTCKEESKSDWKASGCAVVGFVVSPFLAVRDALVGLGDIVTGGYFKMSRKSGVFDYFRDE